MSTPESKVKRAVKRVIAQHGDRVYSHWPVMNGMGEPTLDCNGSIDGLVFYIETKALGLWLTPRQERTRADMMAAGAPVFVINDPFTLAHFDAWLNSRIYSNHPGTPVRVR